jgi:hypothetical protein
MLVYLFENRTPARALTTDVTARNLPCPTAASHWMFVKRLQINQCRPPRCIADFNDALSQLDHFGYYILDPETICAAAGGRAASDLLPLYLRQRTR